MGLRGRNIKKSHTAARNGARRQDRVEHPGRMVVGGIAGGARDFENSITAGERLSDVRTVPNVSRRLRQCDLRHG